MNTIFLPTINKYATDSGIYTADELENLDILEAQWRESLPRHTLQQLLDIFPTALSAARRAEKAKMKEYKSMLVEINNDQEEYYNTVISKAHFSEQNAMVTDSDKVFDEKRRQIESNIKSCVYRLAFLDEREGKAPQREMNGINEAEIARAKEVPIENFYTGKLKKHGKRAVGLCPFVNEKTPSFTIYLDQNSFYCYSCNTGGSVIDYIMMQQDKPFLSVVKELTK